ncbi:L-histidine N(alpha)-methyltransferase [Streptomyces sp. NPDC048489]|uniref:L-histidine N(alpha)-methyltransferase n=1 Tax=Streptomyces sp. NPDC048489 TaxID=3154504 RepID=UPI0034191961
MSVRTVRNWIKQAKEGKLQLELVRVGNNHYVSLNPGNKKVLDEYAGKFRARGRTVKTISPKPEFYRAFTQSQIYDIVRNLEMHHEIPRQYNYFDGGAVEWDKYTAKLAEERVPNLLNSTVDLLEENYGYLDKRLAQFEQINVVDVGVGNALPARQLIGHLLGAGKLGRYIALDISDEMLEIARRNVKAWFDGKVKFEKYQLDITHERFTNLLAEDYLGKSAKKTANLVLFLGGTPFNFRRPSDAFRTINESMNRNDLLVYTDKLETPDMHPQWFNYSTAVSEKLEIASIHRLVFDLLNIDSSFYDVDMGFNPALQQRFTRAILKVGLTLKFNFEEGERTVEFEKGDDILLWRSWQTGTDDVAKLFEQTGFYTLHATQTADREYVLTVSQVKQD